MTTRTEVTTGISEPPGYHTLSERAVSGKAARAKLPRSRHGEWAPARERRDPLEILEVQERSRVPDLVPIRHGRMAASAFAFFRGAAAVMASDLAPEPRTGLTVQLCGDAHLANFGGFAAPDRDLLFDVNDFDETSHGPFEWDLKRLVASFEVSGRDRGFQEQDRRDIVSWASRTRLAPSSRATRTSTISTASSTASCPATWWSARPPLPAA
jgi:hypothetical protein